MFTIALIGRTNVGKSTLFNRIIGAAKAITSEIPHTTRDRNTGTVTWRGVPMRWIDTGGVEEVDRPRRTDLGIEREIRRQVLVATEEADVLALVVDVRDGLLPGERAISRALRAIGKPVLVVCNKVGNARHRIACAEFSALGFGEPIPVAAITGVGVGDLLDHIVESYKPKAISRKPSENEQLTAYSLQLTAPITAPIRIAIVGEPNVGKSSLLNAILGREEVIVRPEPFTTRDVHDVELEVNGRTIILLDTAGIRRLAARAARSSRTRLEAIERLAVRRSLAAIAHADVVALVLDATHPATRHVKQLATAIADAGRACVIVVNKVDLTPSPDGLAERMHHLVPHLAWAPVIATSAITGDGVPAMLPAALHAADAWRRELGGADLSAVHAAVKRRIPTARTAFGRKRSDVVELRQTGTAPPAFLLIARKRVRIPQAIPAIVERAIREHADFAGSPIRITVKSMKG